MTYFKLFKDYGEIFYIKNNNKVKKKVFFYY